MFLLLLLLLSPKNLQNGPKHRYVEWAERFLIAWNVNRSPVAPDVNEIFALKHNTQPKCGFQVDPRLKTMRISMPLTRKRNHECSHVYISVHRLQPSGSTIFFFSSELFYTNGALPPPTSHPSRLKSVTAPTQQWKVYPCHFKPLQLDDVSLYDAVVLYFCRNEREKCVFLLDTGLDHRCKPEALTCLNTQSWEETTSSMIINFDVQYRFLNR